MPGGIKPRVPGRVKGALKEGLRRRLREGLRGSSGGGPSMGFKRKLYVGIVVTVTVSWCNGYVRHRVFQ